MSTQSVNHACQRRGRLGCAIILLAVLSSMCTPQPSPPTRMDANAPATGDTAPTPQAKAPIAEKPDARPDNATCLSCHQNLKGELIARVHERRSVLCADCHGPSAAHRAGGSPQPPPDHIFSPADVDAQCTKCHDRHDQGMIERVVRRREGQKSPKGIPITAESICTDCHGKHILAAD